MSASLLLKSPTGLNLKVTNMGNLSELADPVKNLADALVRAREEYEEELEKEAEEAYRNLKLAREFSKDAGGYKDALSDLTKWAEVAGHGEVAEVVKARRYLKDRGYT